MGWPKWMQKPSLIDPHGDPDVSRRTERQWIDLWEVRVIQGQERASLAFTQQDMSRANEYLNSPSPQAPVPQGVAPNAAMPLSYANYIPDIWSTAAINAAYKAPINVPRSYSPMTISDHIDQGVPTSRREDKFLEKIQQRMGGK